MLSFYRVFRPIYAPIFNRTRRAVRHWRKQIQIWQDVRHYQKHHKPVKVIIGAGHTQYDSWITTDIPFLDVTNPSHWQLYFPKQSIDRLLAEHVFEHLSPEDLQNFLTIVRPYLKSHARIRIAVPDGYHPNPDYIRHVEPNGTGEGADTHQLLYNHELLTSTIEAINYTVDLLVYYDEAGVFHQKEWSTEDGFITRTHASTKPHHQALNYSSLIIDCWDASN